MYVLCSEVTVEKFDTFLTDMEDGCFKMKAKFVDHCNKMSGRKCVTRCLCIHLGMLLFIFSSSFCKKSFF